MSDASAAFFQTPPRIPDGWRDDPSLRGLVARLVPGAGHANGYADGHGDAAALLAAHGARAAGTWQALADAAEREPPRHVPFDAWGRRVDRIETSAAWRALEREAAVHGLVAMGDEMPWGAASRVVQMAALHGFHPASAFVSCPLAMTDGAARALALHGGGDPVLAEVRAHLVTRDPDAFWTAGQWMTERTGGSDVSGTSTHAAPDADGWWRLTGAKWFTSATTSPVALTLARTPGAPAGSAGLSLFCVPVTRDAHGALVGIRVERLKDKLGTRALPTAELALDGVRARLVGDAPAPGAPGRGVARIAAVLTITRVHNAICAAAQARRAVALARDWAAHRVAFGRPLLAHPLHAGTLAALETEVRGAQALALHVAWLLGRDETNVASDAERVALRVLVPVAKLATARWGVAVASEALEAFGGAGYVEDTGLPRLLRDAQVLSIWEGTTNVLALDVRRALASRAGAPGADAPLAALLADLAARAARADAHPALADAARRVREAGATLGAWHARVEGAGDAEAASAGARTFALALARVATGALLLEHAAWAADVQHADAAAAGAAARRWCARSRLAPSALALLDDDGEGDAEARVDTAALLGIDEPAALAASNPSPATARGAVPARA